MLNFYTTYLSLGSNEGDRIFYLQEAINRIGREMGSIESISPVYKSEAQGFKGNEFFNCCLTVRTVFCPEVFIRKVLQIEKEMGRHRSSDNTYQNRSIDIDVLLYENKTIDTPELKIPHPHMLNRAFVLLPLQDIAKNLLHPIAEKRIDELAQNIPDAIHIQKISPQLSKPESITDRYNYVAIEGNIGAGKTSLAHLLTKQYNAKLVLERFADNPFLPKFYADKERFAFPTEMSFLADRYQQLSDDLAQFDLFKSFIISDYYIFKSLIFAQVTLASEEYVLYRRVFDIMYKEITKPDLYIYLYQNTDRLLENIKKRGRDYEQNIESDYLENLDKAYAGYIQSQKDLNTLIIDASKLDFVHQAEDYQKIVKLILKSS